MAHQLRQAALAELAAVLLQAGQHDHVAVIEMGPAKSLGVARAGILVLGRRRADIATAAKAKALKPESVKS